jgi:hypothetical protein
MEIQKVKELALANGFKLKEQASGNMDLNSYVYDFANAIEQAAKAQAVPEGFVSVEDKLPIDGQDVIAFDAIKHCVFKGGEFLQGYIESDTGHEYEEPVEVTHWMAVEAQEPAND